MCRPGRGPVNDQARQLAADSGNRTVLSHRHDEGDLRAPSPSATSWLICARLTRARPSCQPRRVDDIRARKRSRHYDCAHAAQQGTSPLAIGPGSVAGARLRLPAGDPGLLGVGKTAAPSMPGVLGGICAGPGELIGVTGLLPGWPLIGACRWACPCSGVVRACLNCEDSGSG